MVPLSFEGSYISVVEVAFNYLVARAYFFYKFLLQVKILRINFTNFSVPWLSFQQRFHFHFLLISLIHPFYTVG
jgi:hypothetical protein